MGYKLCSNITSPNPTEGATENIGEGLHYKEMYSMYTTLFKNWRIQITR